MQNIDGGCPPRALASRIAGLSYLAFRISVWSTPQHPAQPKKEHSHLYPPSLTPISLAYVSHLSLSLSVSLSLSLALPPASLSISISLASFALTISLSRSCHLSPASGSLSLALSLSPSFLINSQHIRNLTLQTLHGRPLDFSNSSPHVCRGIPARGNVHNHRPCTWHTP